ncbi:MAG TPA: hypothetical protein VLB86_07905 [Gaiellaceae bacterium]|nr:hypothetical protein [Gaiellaceae bacterium]
MPTQVLTEIDSAPAEEFVDGEPSKQDEPVATETPGVELQDAGVQCISAARVAGMVVAGSLVVIAGAIAWRAVVRARAKRRPALLQLVSVVPPRLRRRRPRRFAFVNGSRPLNAIALDRHVPFVRIEG